MNNRLVLGLITISLTACAATPTPPTNGGLIHQQNEGYSILYQLMKDESQVAGIFAIKHADDSVGDLIRQIAQTCKIAQQQMQTFPKTDNQIEFDEPDLPLIEQRSRDLTAKREAEVLLFSGGKSFERRLIFTQAQAMGYATELCKALDENETDPIRKEFLKTLADQCDNLFDRLMAMLTVTP